mmetsp:Transcript_60104/g.140021  ORF Transcript_60104/g.140021 Transcript_60104/m.140021 type:complete len:238 (-) Transcript_60104:119-832(-)|eukprot:CAMPEP_0171109026 /NCGR_PEP_ID=MMETSP0766_2-20121228/70120_1 /TAXON_ID=439317 /ORGANISM="Gambierdiscus australes, Strain CAWD 149" /LENGTH=237 /DNA_ID=CAMNT_0011570675 /DNA_START=52 /DNA_END=765 /DNA_ORIENTATION=+
MPVLRVCFLVAGLRSAASAAAPPQHNEVQEALRIDDTCQASGGDECDLSMRQLRGEAQVAAVAAVANARHDPNGTGKTRAASQDAAAAAAVHMKRQVVASVAPHNHSAELLETADHVNASERRAGQCSAADQAKMAKFGGGNADGTFPKVTSECGRGAFSWFKFHPDQMNRCLVREVGISSECASCFAEAGQYSSSNCKFACLFGSWCSHSCLNCASQGNKQAQICAGVPTPKASFC